MINRPIWWSWERKQQQNMPMRITDTRRHDNRFEVHFEDMSRCICIQSGIFHNEFDQVVGLYTNLHTYKMSGFFINHVNGYDEVFTPALSYDAHTDNLTINLVTPESIPFQDPPPSYNEPRVTLLGLAGLPSSVGAIRIHNASLYVPMNEDSI